MLPSSGLSLVRWTKKPTWSRRCPCQLAPWRFQDWDLRLWLGKGQAWLLTLRKYRRWMELAHWR